MKCPNCNMNINDNSKFCIHCGKQFNQVEGKYCVKCGAELIPGSSFCGVCGMSLTPNAPTNTNVVPTNNNSDVNEGSTPTVLGIISLLLYYAGPVIVGLLTIGMPSNAKYAIESIVSLTPLAGIVTMIIGRVKYPKNKFLKVVMWIIICSILFIIIIFILIFLWCWITCSTMDTSGCS